MSGRAIWIVLGIAKPPLLTSSSDGSTLFPSTSILTSDDAVISSYSMPKRLIRKWSCRPGTRAVMRVLIKSDQPNRSTRREQGARSTRVCHSASAIRGERICVTDMDVPFTKRCHGRSASSPADLRRRGLIEYPGCRTGLGDLPYLVH